MGDGSGANGVAVDGSGANGLGGVQPFASPVPISAPISAPYRAAPSRAPLRFGGAASSPRRVLAQSFFSGPSAPGAGVPTVISGDGRVYPQVSGNGTIVPLRFDGWEIISQTTGAVVAYKEGFGDDSRGWAVNALGAAHFASVGTGINQGPVTGGISPVMCLQIIPPVGWTQAGGYVVKFFSGIDVFALQYDCFFTLATTMDSDGHYHFIAWDAQSQDATNPTQPQAETVTAYWFCDGVYSTNLYTNQPNPVPTDLSLSASTAYGVHLLDAPADPPYGVSFSWTTSSTLASVSVPMTAQGVTFSATAFTAPDLPDGRAAHRIGVPVPTYCVQTSGGASGGSDPGGPPVILQGGGATGFPVSLWPPPGGWPAPTGTPTGTPIPVGGWPPPGGWPGGTVPAGPPGTTVPGSGSTGTTTTGTTSTGGNGSNGNGNNGNTSGANTGTTADGGPGYGTGGNNTSGTPVGTTDGSGGGGGGEDGPLPGQPPSGFYPCQKLLVNGPCVPVGPGSGAGSGGAGGGGAGGGGTFHPPTRNPRPAPPPGSADPPVNPCDTGGATDTLGNPCGKPVTAPPAKSQQGNTDPEPYITPNNVRYCAAAVVNFVGHRAGGGTPTYSCLYGQIDPHSGVYHYRGNWTGAEQANDVIFCHWDPIPADSDAGAVPAQDAVASIFFDASLCGQGQLATQAGTTTTDDCNIAGGFPDLVFSPASKFYLWPVELITQSVKVWQWAIFPQQCSLDNAQKASQTFFTTGIFSVPAEIGTTLSTAQACGDDGPDKFAFWTLADFAGGCPSGGSGLPVDASPALRLLAVKRVASLAAAKAALPGTGNLFQRSQEGEAATSTPPIAAPASPPESNARVVTTNGRPSIVFGPSPPTDPRYTSGGYAPYGGDHGYPDVTQVEPNFGSTQKLSAFPTVLDLSSLSVPLSLVRLCMSIVAWVYFVQHLYRIALRKLGVDAARKDNEPLGDSTIAPLATGPQEEMSEMPPEMPQSHSRFPSGGGGRRGGYHRLTPED